MISKSVVSIILLRVVLPVCLSACVCLRQDALTGVYLLLLLYLPFVPLPTSRTMVGHTGVFLRVVMILSFLMALAQLAFQIVLIVMSPYGYFLQEKCKGMEKMLRLVGFIRYDKLPVLDCMLHILPEVIMVFGSVFVQQVCERLNLKQRSESGGEQGLLISVISSPEPAKETQPTVPQKKTLMIICIIGKYLTLVTLCGVSILVPSITTGILFLIFLTSVTYWACYRDLRKGFAITCRFTAFVVFLYLTAIYCYQIQNVQDIITPKSRIARYFGLQILRMTNCTDDPRLYYMNDSLKWPSFVLPMGLIFLYYLLILESRILLIVTDVCTISADVARKIGTRLLPTPTEETPLIRGRESAYKSSGNQGIMQDKHGSIILSNISGEDENQKGQADGNANASVKADVIDYLMDALVTIVYFIMRTSYLATNIIMMTWSITYHSWLTFVLLLWASVLWILPNQRSSMLRSSPFLVFYVEFLLISQFFLGMNLTDAEFPGIFSGIAYLEEWGFAKEPYPFKKLLIKTLFTTMFWITLRQYCQERQEARSTSTVAHMMAPVHVTVGTATTLGGEPVSKGGQIIKKFGERLRRFLTKCWIWVVTITLFAIGVMGTEMTMFRIIYTALAIIFVLTFQLSWVIWRKIMYGFWLTVIIISMIILIMIYTYQFKEVPKFWERMGLSREWQSDIGLEEFNTGELLVRLIIPTFFVIITVIQLKYFHKDFLQLSDIKSRGTSIAKLGRNQSYYASDEEETFSQPDEEESPKTEEATVAPHTTTDENKQEKVHISSTPEKNVEKEISSTPGPSTRDQPHLQPQTSKRSFRFSTRSSDYQPEKMADVLKHVCKELVEVLWGLLEQHMRKIILVLVMLVCVNDVCAMHFGFVLAAVLAMMMSSRVQDLVIRLMSLVAAILLLAKMMYQFKIFKADYWNATCEVNTTGSIFTNNTAEWLGFEKTAKGHTVTYLITGYIWIILLVTIYVVAITRQKYVRHLKGRPLSKPRTLFPRISYKDMDKDVIYCVKYLLNYGFYRFGIEFTLISMVILIGSRLDFYALIYAIWLVLFIMLSRNTLSRIWYPFNIFVAVTIPVQYSIVVGPPPELCFGYFHYTINNTRLISTLEWMYLPHNDGIPNSHKLIWDFILLLMVTRQTRAFRIEYQYKNTDYPGGSNKSIIHELESPSYVNPVPDFISSKRSWLDIVKHIVLCSLMWLSCAAVFMAGTNSVTIFSLGYVISSFLLLWQGNDFYLLPINTILRTWNRLIFYNVFVILIKTVLQIPGCIFIDVLKENACWLIKLLGIVCIKNFSGTSAPPVTDTVTPVLPTDTCSVLEVNAGLIWDAVCFVLLIFQRRLFCSNNFVRIVDEAKAMAILAARGAELIEELSQKKIKKQMEIERTVLEKIKNKMDSIKAAQKRILAKTHYTAIRSGDYYMFDEDEAVDILESTKEDPGENSDDLDNNKTPTLGKLMETVMKTGDIKQVVDSSGDSGTRRSSRYSVSKTDDISDGSLSDDEGECSTCQVKSTDATSSKDATDVPERERMRRLSRKGTKDGRERRRDSDTYSHSTECSCDECCPGEKSGLIKCWDRFIMYLKFAAAFINSMMESVIRFLNQHSRDYRYVIKALDREKKSLKETKNLRLGMRITPTMKWQPIPTGPSSVPPTSPLKIEEFDSEGLVTSAQPTFVRLIIAINHALMSHSDMVCYFAVFVLQIRNPTILSLPLPLMVFLWGTLSMPRPTKTFWVTIIAYTELIVVIKSICQSDMLPWNAKPLLDDKPWHLVRILGIEKDNYYAIYDLALLLTVFFHRSTMKSLGLWKSTEDSNKTNRGSNLLNIKCIDPQSGTSSGEKESDVATEVTVVNLAASSDNMLSADSSQSYQNQAHCGEDMQESSTGECISRPVLIKTKGFFNKLLDSQNRIADDVYAYMFLCDFVNIIVIIFGFSSFGAVRGDGGVTQYIEENKIPFTFLAMLLLQFGLIIMDRSLYLSKSIFGKIIFQYVLVIGIHIWMFFILPGVTDRQFTAVLPPSIWYLVKCCYLLLSAYQIRSGYPTRILGNFLCKNYNLVNMVLFKVFMLIPFVFELRTLMDWIWTETSMTLGDWIMMEDIFAQIFQLKCTRRAESKYPLERGQKIRTRTKVLYGGGGLLTLIALIWFPLVLFSLGNTVGKANIPWDVTLSVKIGSYQSIFSTSKDQVNNMTEDEFGTMKHIYELSGNAQTFLSDYTAEDIGIVHLPCYSTSVWTIPPPEIEDFVAGLNNPTISVDILVKWSLHRKPSNPEDRTEVSDEYTRQLDMDVRKGIAAVLRKQADNITVPNLMPKFLKVTSVTPGTATPIPQLMSAVDITDYENQKYVNVSFVLNKKDKDNVTLSMWWDMIEAEPDPSLSFLKNLPHNNISNVLTIYTFNDKAFPEGLLSYISGKGIIGLYTTFVIVVSAWIRGFFTGISSQIMFEELPYVDRILQLCLDIYLVRERRELDLEEDLFAKLIFLYRSPETMIKWTRPPEDDNE